MSLVELEAFWADPGDTEYRSMRTGETRQPAEEPGQLHGKTVAVIGDQYLLQQGEGNIRAQLNAKGWDDFDIWFYAAAGKTPGTADVNGFTTVQNIAQARDALGVEPDTWVIALGANGAGTNDSAEVTAILTAIGTATRKIVWMGLSQSAATNTNNDAFNTTAKALVQAHSKGWWGDWNLVSKATDQTGFWSGAQDLAGVGQEWASKFLANMAGWTPDHPELIWTPAKLNTGYMAPPTGPEFIAYTDIPGYNPAQTVRANLVKLNTILSYAGSMWVTFPEGEFVMSEDFNQGGNNNALRLDQGTSGATGCTRVRGLIGSGRGTVFLMEPMSSTRASAVPAQGSGGTNPLYLMHFRQQTLSIDDDHPVLAQCTLVGTEQGHLHHGVQLNQSHGGVVRDVFLQGASPGDANSPPGETFGIDLWRSNFVHLHDFEIDGRNASGTRRTGSPFGWNTGNYAKVQRGYVHHSKAGMPTFWETIDLYTEDLWSESNGSAGGGLSGSGINHEEVYGNCVHMRPSMRPQGRWEAEKGNTAATDNPGLHLTLSSALYSSIATRLWVMDPLHDQGPSIQGALAGRLSDTYRNSTNDWTVDMITVTKNGKVLAGRDANNQSAIPTPPGGWTVNNFWMRHH